MKKLILVRHGKSSWDYQVDDKDRPLKERGITDAHRVANVLREKNYKIDFCYSSPANRALHTCLIFLRTLRFDFNNFKITDELYDFSGEAAFKFLKSLSDDLSTVMIFGHNYAFTTLVNMLGDDYLENLPTSGMAILEFNINNWTDLKKGNTKAIVLPKELR